MPTHNHIVVAAVPSNADESVNVPTSQTWLGTSNPGFGYSDTSMAPTAFFAGQAIGITGGSQPHDNMQPYLVMNFCIALEGIFPPRG
jgi:microcystin-dependent protein